MSLQLPAPRKFYPDDFELDDSAPCWAACVSAATDYFAVAADEHQPIVIHPRSRMSAIAVAANVAAAARISG